MKKVIDYYSYIFKYSFKLKYLNWNYLGKNKAKVFFIILNLLLLGYSSYKSIDALKLSAVTFKSPIEFFTKWVLSFNTGVIVFTFLSLLTKIRPILLSYRKESEITNNGVLGSNKDYRAVVPQKGYQSLTHNYYKGVAGSDELAKFTDTVFYSPELNNYLINSDKIEIELTNKDQKIQDFIFRNFKELKIFLKIRYRNSKNKTLLNEHKLCLSEDIEIGKPIKCHKGTYFDTMLTNDVAGCYIKDSIKAKTLVEQQVELPIEICDGYPNTFMRISETTLNNNMGGSTIVFTSDNHLVFWIQSGSAQHSEGLIAPTGSGSCDFKDLTENDFIQSIKKTMERELLEESTGQVDFNSIVETKIIGYFRWQSRGGLPQIVGITKINLKKDELAANVNEIREPINSVEKMSLYRNFSDTTTGLQDILTYLQIRLETTPNLSVPLFYNLHALIDYINNYPLKAHEFFFGK